MGRLLRQGEFPATRGFLGWDHREARQDTALDALLVIQATAGGPGRAGQLCQALIRGFPCTGVAQAAHVTGLMEHEEVVARGACLLATGIRLRLLRVFRTLEGSCGPIMANRAEGAETSVGGVVSRAATSSAGRAGSRSWSDTA
jgi:hypothetical protein